MTTEAPAKKGSDLDALKAELREAKKTIKAQQKEIDELSPTFDVTSRLFNSAEDVYKYFPVQRLRDMAEAQLTAENRQRRRRDLSPLTYTEEEWELAIAELAEELLADRTLNGAPEDGPLMRVLKMYNPKDGSIRQIPYEGQFNNIAGSLADGIVLYEKKGFKRCSPMLCPSLDCNQVAAVEKSGARKGQWTFQGYCSEDHYRRTEKRDGNALPGVVNRPSVTGPRS